MTDFVNVFFPILFFAHLNLLLSTYYYIHCYTSKITRKNVYCTINLYNKTQQKI